MFNGNVDFEWKRTSAFLAQVQIGVHFGFNLHLVLDLKMLLDRLRDGLLDEIGRLQVVRTSGAYQCAMIGKRLVNRLAAFPKPVVDNVHGG